LAFKLDAAREAEIVEFIEGKFEEYRRSAFFQNWKLLCENIRDAVEMRWRPGEQLTRTGLYIASMNAARNGFREGFIDTFGQARPLWAYKPRAKFDMARINKVEEMMENTWEDIDGLTSWYSQLDDAIDYGMGVAYTSWCRYGAEAERPVVETQAWGDALEWKDEFNILLNQPDIARVHPFNYASDPRGGHKPGWEGCEWEWSMAAVSGFQTDPKYIRPAIAYVLKLFEEGKIDNTSQTFYNVADQQGGDKPEDKVYAKEYWGSLKGIKGLERDVNEYAVTVCQGKVVRFNVNKIRGARVWRPFKRTRLITMNDLPIGQHILAPMLGSHRFRNLMMNLSADDLLIKQHLGLAVWPNALKNPNDLLNPEGARGVLFMRDNATVNQIPRFFTEGASGLQRDAGAFLDRVDAIDQMAGLNHSAMGMNTGGEQNQTATGQRFLASTANRRTRAALITALDTGLKPIGKDLMLLTLRNRPPEDLGLSPEEHIEIFDNNYWEASDTVSWDKAQMSMAMANFGQVALQKMAEVVPAQGGADHVVEYIKDTGKMMGVPTSWVERYFPKQLPPSIGASQVAGGSPAAPAPPPPAALEAGPMQAPMVGNAMTEEEVQGAMA
jgi:hypothetical protein